MKKLLLVLLGSAILFSFVSCGSKPENEEAPKPSAPEETVVEETIEEPVVADTSAEDAAKKADEEARKRAKEAYEKALAAKLEIEESELIEYDQKHYDEGNRLLAELEAMFKDDSVTGAQLEAKANDVNAQYNSVLFIGYKQLAKYWRDEAYESKRKADSVKAGVAEKDRYKKAVKDFKEGDTLYAMQAAEKAIDHYIDADDEFSALYTEISDKRAAAQAAIEEAKRKVQEAEAAATKADFDAPITEENVEGIEDEDTVLLEEDNYQNPDEAVEEVPETIVEAVVDTAVNAAEEIKNLVGGDK